MRTILSSFPVFGLYINSITVQAKIELMSFIETVSAKVNTTEDVQIKGSRSVRKSAKKQRHKDIGGVIDE